MRRMVLTTAVTAAGLVALLSLKPHQTGAAPAAAGGGGHTSAGAARSGSFTGDAVDTRYGPVQVKVALAAGRITKVTVVQVPRENPRDQEIASFSVPRLTEEALAAQSARIDTVSGATFTSQGYIQSLQSALDRAGA